MNIITIDELITKCKNKNIKIFFEGVITTNIKIEQAVILKTGHYIEIYSNKKTAENIKINIHQIMKIEIISNKLYIIKGYLRYFHISIKIIYDYF